MAQGNIAVSDKTFIYNRIFFGLAMVLLLTMPLKSNFNSGAQILLLLVFLFKPGAYAAVRSAFRKPSVLAFVLFFGLHVVSVINSDNFNLYSKELLLKSSMLFIPVILAGANWSDAQRRVLLGAFIFAVTSTCLYSFGKNFFLTFPDNYFEINALRQNNWEHFWYMVPIVINFHAPYFSLYIVVALIMLWFCFPKMEGKMKKIGMVFLGLFLLFFLTLLSSRTAIFSFIVVFFAWGFVRIYKKSGFKMVILFSIAGFAVLSLAIYSAPFLKSKLESGTGVSSRYYMWKAGINIMKRNPFFGVGTGDIKPVLYQEYENIGFAEGVKEKYNTHNQFIQTGIGLGIVGILALLACLFIPFVEAYRNVNLPLLFFILAFGICCFTEALLSRQHGVILFSVFCGLLLPIQNSKPLNKL